MKTNFSLGRSLRPVPVVGLAIALFGILRLLPDSGALAAGPQAAGNNITALTAQTIRVNSASPDSLSNARTEAWYRVRLFASRSYQFSAWPVDHEQGTDASTLDLSIFSDNAGTTPASPAPTLSTVELEGSSNSNGDTRPVSMLFQPTATGVYKFRVRRISGGTVPHSINVAVRETTLFSAWTSKAAGFEGFIEMHNNTKTALSVSLRAYDSAGVLQGSGLAITLQPNATEVRTAAQVGLPVNVFAGVVLTHNGAFGAVSANVTTLNGANGLSFDSPFTPRNSTVIRDRGNGALVPLAPTVTTGVASSLTKTTALLSGNVNDNNAATAATFDYGLTTGYGTNTAATPATVAAGARNTTVTFSAAGLTCSSTYHFRAKGTNSVGTTLGGDQAFDTLNCAATVPTATTNAASGVLQSAATLNGTVNDNLAPTTVTFEYGPTAAYGTIASATPGTLAAGAGSTAVALNLTGLTCGSTYHFRVNAVNGVGATAGGDLSFNTSACLPPTATTNAATGLGLTTATLNGTVNDNFAATTVTFEYGLTTAYGTSAATPGTIAAGAGSTAVSLNVTGLMCGGLTYHFRVKAVNVGGTTNGGDLSFTTPNCAALTAHPRLWLSDPTTIARLTAAANANSTEWLRLKNWCDTHTLVGIGAEYQGLEAHRFVGNFGLCYRITLVKSGGGVGPAATYAQKAIAVLQDPTNAGAGNPTGKQNLLTFTGYCTDSGFGVRAYVPAMAMAYDWLFDSPLMTASIKSQIITRINAWLNWYASGGAPGCADPGYANSDYISNYNAGYTTSSVLAAIAINGEDASAAAMYTAAVNRFNAAHQLFDLKMPGGHWPEGWNYGPLVYQSHLMAASALRSFTGVASYVIGKSWMSNNVPFKLQAMAPDGNFFYDDGLWSGDGYGDVRFNDIAAAGLAYGWNSTNGALAKLYINKTLAADPSNLIDEEWKGFLLYDPTATPASVASLPRSHFAQGLGLTVMRSDWTSGQATWATAATAGQYLSYQGEQDKDQGHITLYKGAPLLLDVGQDLFTDAATYNTFLHNSITMDGRTDGTAAQGGVDYPPAPFQGTQTSFSQECTTPPGGASTPIGNNAFIDAGEYLLTSGEFSAAYQTNPLNFPDPCGRVPVNWMNRSVFYLRPDVFVVYDQVRKRTTGPGGSQANITPTQHWHFPTGATTLNANRQVSVDSGGGRLHFQTVFPATTTSTMVNEARNASDYPGVANSHLSVRQSGGNPVYQNFLTVMRAGLANGSYVFPTVTGITGTNAVGTRISGLLAAESATPIVVIFADNGLLTFPASISYQYPSAVPVRNFVMKLKPNQMYTITPVVAGGTVTVTITEGGATSTDSAGVLVFNQ